MNENLVVLYGPTFVLTMTWLVCLYFFIPQMVKKIALGLLAVAAIAFVPTLL